MTLSMWVNLAALPGFGVEAKLVSWGNIDATNDVIRGLPDGLNSFVGIGYSGGTAYLHAQIRSPLDTIHAFKGSPSDNYIGYAPPIPQKGQQSSTRASAQGHYPGKLVAMYEMTIIASSAVPNHSHCEGSASGSRSFVISAWPSARERLRGRPAKQLSAERQTLDRRGWRRRR